MLNKFLLSGLLLTSSLAVLSSASAMDVSDEQKLVLPAKKLAKGWKNEVFKEGNGVYYVAGTVENRQMFKMEDDFTGVKSGGVFVFNRPGICNLTVQLLSSIDPQKETPTLVQTLKNIHLTEPVEEKISSSSGKSSAFEMVKLDDYGNLILSQDQMRKAIETGTLKTENGTFSVTSSGFLCGYWSQEITCISTYSGFQFSHELPFSTYKKKLNSETNQWEDDYSQPARFHQIFNPEVKQWEDDLGRPVFPEFFTFNLTKL